LIPKDQGPDIKGKKNFYWMSGSSFALALQLNPEIAAANHYCGPGNTFFAIKKLLVDNENGKAENLRVALDYDHWASQTWKD